MSIENRNLSSLMPAWISVLGTGNNKVFAFTLAGSERDAGTPTIKAYRPNRREFAVVRPVFTTLLGGIHHSNRCLPPNSYLRTSDRNPLHRRATASQRASQRLSVKRGTESIERSPKCLTSPGEYNSLTAQEGAHSA